VREFVGSGGDLGGDSFEHEREDRGENGMMKVGNSLGKICGVRS
jgi:hypothetical protein